MKITNVVKKKIRTGYNRISHRYRNDLGRGEDAKNMKPWLVQIQSHLSAKADILELGCGTGIPVGSYFAKKNSYLGIDISDVQIKRAKKLVPQGKFKRADMHSLRFPTSSFDAVLSFYAIIHLPLREQRPLLKRVFRWLKPGGLFAATLGHKRWTGWDKNWYGAKMFWSHSDSKTYQKWLTQIGFKMIHEKTIPEGPVSHVLLMGVKPSKR